METSFTPMLSAAGGALIGLSAVLLMAVLGRIMGATGILSGAILPVSRDQAGWHPLTGWHHEAGWRWAVLAGMVSGPIIVWLATGWLPEVDVPASLPMLVVGGLLVGVGVTLGGGCTSGHGVCGLARLSPRSLVAVPAFMASTALTVFVIRHGFGG